MRADIHGPQKTQPADWLLIVCHQLSSAFAPFTNTEVTSFNLSSRSSSLQQIRKPADLFGRIANHLMWCCYRSNLCIRTSTGHSSQTHTQMRDNDQKNKWVREEVCHMARSKTKREEWTTKTQLLIKNGLICSEAAVIIISGDVKRLRFSVSRANTQIQSTDNRGSFLHHGHY